MKRVAVILVNYKDYAQRFLAPCYEGLRARSYSKEQSTLFIVDNASTDQTQSTLKRLAPEARILPNAENLGWAGGNNVAIRLALREGFDYMVSLNMDTVLDRDWLKNLVEEAERKQEIHILQSKVLLYGMDRINFLGDHLQFLSYYNLGNAFLRQTKFQEAIAQYQKALEIKPDYSQARQNLAVTLREQKKQP